MYPTLSYNQDNFEELLIGSFNKYGVCAIEDVIDGDYYDERDEILLVNKNEIGDNKYEQTIIEDVIIKHN